jgi:hypothetical protein
LILQYVRKVIKLQPPAPPSSSRFSTKFTLASSSSVVNFLFRLQNSAAQVLIAGFRSAFAVVGGPLGFAVGMFRVSASDEVEDEQHPMAHRLRRSSSQIDVEGS